MHKNFTQTATEAQNVKKQTPKPSASTISFIKQFARVCSYKKMSAPELGVMLAN